MADDMDFDPIDYYGQDYNTHEAANESGNQWRERSYDSEGNAVNVRFVREGYMYVDETNQTRPQIEPRESFSTKDEAITYITDVTRSAGVLVVVEKYDEWGDVESYDVYLDYEEAV